MKALFRGRGFVLLETFPAKKSCVPKRDTLAASHWIRARKTLLLSNDGRLNQDSIYKGALVCANRFFVLPGVCLPEKHYLRVKNLPSK